MQFKQSLSILLIAAASLVTSQSITDIPTCAQAGAVNAITASGCKSSDIACICKSDAFSKSLESYAKTNCSPQDYTTAITAGQAICGKAIASASSSTSISVTSKADMARVTSSSMAPSMSGNATLATTTIDSGCTCGSHQPTAVATYTGAAMRQVDTTGAVAGLLAFLEVLALL